MRRWYGGAVDTGLVIESFVLRLSSQALAAGEVVGRVEAVASGEESLVRSIEELLAFLSGRGRAAPEQPAEAT